MCRIRGERIGARGWSALWERLEDQKISDLRGALGGCSRLSIVREQETLVLDE